MSALTRVLKDKLTSLAKAGDTTRVEFGKHMSVGIIVERMWE